MIATVTIMGENVPDRFVVFMLLVLLLLVFEVRAWIQMIEKDKKKK